MSQADSHPGGSRKLVVGATAIVYALLVLAVPFIGDLGVPTVVVAVLWLGGSYVAGALAPWRLMALIPIGASIVFTVMVLQGDPLDSTFFSDPLSIMAIPPLAAGELLALYLGSETMRSRRSRAVV